MQYLALNTHGDPLGTLHSLLRQVWLDADLEGMVATPNGDAEGSEHPRYITDVELVDQVNPFKPLMEINTARLIPGVLTQNPGVKIGTLLRPCEMRALVEMSKHTSIKLDDLLTISVDCLGTLPADEYQWRLDRFYETHPSHTNTSTSATTDLAEEALAFARQGGIIPYRYRSSCQVCHSAASEHANVNIHIFGLPVRQKMLISFSDPGLSDKVHLEKFAASPADPALIAQHERIVSKMGERHARTMERVNQDLGDLLPDDLEAVIQQLESCGACQACMDVCPICSVVRPYRDTDGHYERSGVMRWLVSCAGCGMCEQTCPTHLPTSAMFAKIRLKLAQDLEYVPGRSLDESLPRI